jgi:hypothetical protein
VHTWLWSQPKAFFADWIRRLVNHSTICIEKRGWLVVQKCYILHLSQTVVHKIMNIFIAFFHCALY